MRQKTHSEGRPLAMMYFILHGAQSTSRGCLSCPLMPVQSRNFGFPCPSGLRRRAAPRAPAPTDARYDLQEEHDVALQLAQELALARVSPDSPLERNPNRENPFLTLRLLQPGQVTFDESAAFATSSSKAFPHFRHSYSYIGMAFSSPVESSLYDNAEAVVAVSSCALRIFSKSRSRCFLSLRYTEVSGSISRAC